MLFEHNSSNLLEAYNSDTFRKNGYKVIDILADYLDQATSKKLKPVLPLATPGKNLEEWQGNFSADPSGSLEDFITKAIYQSNHLHHPLYVGHQIAPPLPAATLCDMVSSFLNNSTAIFEMGPVSTVLEKRIISWMAGLIGFDDKSDGILTSGGTLGNLTSLLAARQAKAGYNIWKDGVKEDPPLSIMVSEQAHYSIKRAGQIMGLGEEGVILIPVDKNYSIDMNALKQRYREAVDSGRKVIAIVGSACTTATGSYDPLEKIADFCEENDIWFHVDGAHGASALVSRKYRSLLNGVNRADSVIWDAHKMLLMPALITAVIFKNGTNSYEAFSQKAAYLFEKEAKEEWYNLAQRTMECTKSLMSLKLYTCLSVYGTDFFDSYVTKMYDLTHKFASIIENSIDFELAMKPQSNIICFRYNPESENNNIDNINSLQKHVRKAILETESFYIVQTKLKGTIYLRCTLVNPFTTENDLLNLLDEIRKVANFKVQP